MIDKGDSLLSNKYFVYDCYNKRNLQIDTTQLFTVNLLKNLKSFETDITMIITVMENRMENIAFAYQGVKLEIKSPIRHKGVHLAFNKANTSRSRNQFKCNHGRIGRCCTMKNRDIHLIAYYHQIHEPCS